MKGVVFNIMEAFLIDNFGEDAYEDILEKAGLSEEAFVGPGNYSDDKFMNLFGAALEVSGLEANTALNLFGEYMFPKLAAAYPGFDENFPDCREMLKQIDSVIHVEVRKLYPDALTPVFSYEDGEDGDLILYYTSKRDMPDLVMGLVKGASAYYSQEVDISYEGKLDDTNQHKFIVQCA